MFENDHGNSQGSFTAHFSFEETIIIYFVRLFSSQSVRSQEIIDYELTNVLLCVAKFSSFLPMVLKLILRLFTVEKQKTRNNNHSGSIVN